MNKNPKSKIVNFSPNNYNVKENNSFLTIISRKKCRVLNKFNIYGVICK